MADEKQYREALHKAQHSLDVVVDFLGMLRRADRAKDDEILRTLVEDTEKRARRMEQELDQLWDLFKRPTNQQLG